MRAPEEPETFAHHHFVTTDSLEGESTELAGRHLLLIGIYYGPEETGIAPYTTALAEHLVARGMRVTVLAGMPHYPQWKIFSGYRGRLAVSENLNGVDVRRIRTFIPSRQTAIQRAVYEATFAAHVLSLRKVLEPDAAIGVVPNLSGGLVAAIAGRRFKCPYGLWVQDLTGPAAAQSGISGGSGRVAEVTSKVEGQILRAASRIAIVSEAFRPYLHDHGIATERLQFLPNWSHCPPPTRDRFEVREELGWARDEYVVLHAGNMGLKQGLEEVVKAARLVGDAGRIRFALLGDGNQRVNLETLAKDLPNLGFIDPVPQQEFANILNAADVLLVNERPSVTDMSLPSKLTSYFLAGRPILAAVSQDGATAQFLGKTRTALIVPAGDSRALVDAVEILGREPELRTELVSKATQLANDSFTASGSLSKFERFLIKLLESA